MDKYTEQALMNFGLQLSEAALTEFVVPAASDLFRLLARVVHRQVEPETTLEIGARMIADIATRWSAEWPEDQVVETQRWAVRQLLTDQGEQPTNEDVQAFMRLAAIKNRTWT